MMPITEAVMILPEILEPGNTRLQRIHNRVVKEALAEALLMHHKTAIPHHFNFYRQKKYGYKKRQRETVAKKQRRDKADLVKTGRTKRRMKSIRIRAGGSASGGRVTVTGILKFKQGMKQRTGGKGVTRDVMRDEISRWTEQEEEAATNFFLDRYAEKIDQEIKSKRVRMRLASKLRGIGITP